MTRFTENGQPYSPAIAMAQVASITLGSMLAVCGLVEMLKRKEEKGIER